MAITDAARLRGLLNDVDEDDPVLSDEQIKDLLQQSDGDVERAAYDGWRMKAAYYADLVDITEGNASRKMGDLHKHALDMMSAYSRTRGGPTEGRTRIGRIRRGV